MEGRDYLSHSSSLVRYQKMRVLVRNFLLIRRGPAPKEKNDIEEAIEGDAFAVFLDMVVFEQLWKQKETILDWVGSNQWVKFRQLELLVNTWNERWANARSGLNIEPAMKILTLISTWELMDAHPEYLGRNAAGEPIYAKKKLPSKEECRKKARDALNKAAGKNVDGDVNMTRVFKELRLDGLPKANRQN